MTLQHVEWEDCLLEPSRDAALEREIATFGFLPPHVRFFLPCPWLARTVASGHIKLAHLPGELADLVFLAVSQDNSCRFCYAAQRGQLRIMGFDEERIRRLEEASFMAEDDPRERAVLDFARQVSQGPFAYVAAALDGSPVARFSRSISEAAWSSPILPRRTKALVYAVVARGLGSKRAEREACELLGPMGLAEGDVEEILSHLSSPKLDPVEAAIVPFARETIRPRPADIQRRGKKLREGLTAPEFLELVGIVGLANATVRLSLALCEH